MSGLTPHLPASMVSPTSLPFHHIYSSHFNGRIQLDAFHKASLNKPREDIISETIVDHTLRTSAG
jgi:hypothetical protein